MDQQSEPSTSSADSNPINSEKKNIEIPLHKKACGNSILVSPRQVILF